MQRVAALGAFVSVLVAELWFALSARCDDFYPRKNRVKGTSPAACAECHRDIVQQWKRSAHAEAWTDPEYVEATDQRALGSCLPCHAPKPLLEQAESEPAELRERRRTTGVDCHACHAVGCAYAGRYDTFGPHGMKHDTTRLPCSKFCGRCHEYEHEEYTKLYKPSVAKDKRPSKCTGCHMPAYYSRLTQGHLLSLIHPKRLVHDHSFPVWTDRVLRGAVEVSEVSVVRHDEKHVDVSFTLTNQGAGHRIPTGKYGHRELKITAELLDADGHVLAGGGTSLFGSRQNGLEPGKPRAVLLRREVPAAPPPAQLRILVERVNEDRSFCKTLATESKRVDLNAHEEPETPTRPRVGG